MPDSRSVVDPFPYPGIVVGARGPHVSFYKERSSKLRRIAPFRLLERGSPAHCGLRGERRETLTHSRLQYHLLYLSAAAAHRKWCKLRDETSQSLKLTIPQSEVLEAAGRFYSHWDQPSSCSLVNRRSQWLVGFQVPIKLCGWVVKQDVRRPTQSAAFLARVKCVETTLSRRKALQGR